jgi:hypothetical protein
VFFMAVSPVKRPENPLGVGLTATSIFNRDRDYDQPLPEIAEALLQDPTDRDKHATEALELSAAACAHEYIAHHGGGDAGLADRVRVHPK